MEGKRIYLPMTVKCLMPESMYKVIDVLFAYQKDGIVSYSKATTKCLRMDEVIADQCVQSAIDIGILTFIEKEGGIYRFKINEEKVNRLSETITWKDVPKSKLISLSPEIKFKNDYEEIKPSSNIDNMSDEDMKKMILVMQARLKEREEVKNIVKKLVSEPVDAPDELPW